jgi:hypothetical protein
MTCSVCRRNVIVAWYRDGTPERVCTGCINRALREAGKATQVIDVLERMRKLGLG